MGTLDGRVAVQDLQTKAVHFAEVPFELNHPLRSGDGQR